MTKHVEIKYQKFPVTFGQRLTEAPAFAPWKQAGWSVTWQYRKVEQGGVYIETLMKRSNEPQCLIDLVES